MEQIDIAILWLEHNEGEAEEQAACNNVAEWLKAEQENRRIRSIAREAKCPAWLAREALKKAALK